MKTLLHSLYVLIALVLFTGCTKEQEDEAIWINFINTTENKITQAKAQERDLGNIAGKGQSGYVKLEELGNNSTIPVISFYGQLNGQYLESMPLRCGNGTGSLPAGRYDVLVETVDYGNVSYFTLTFR